MLWKNINIAPKYNALIPKLEQNNPLLRELYSEKDIFEANNVPFIIHY